jgi:transposase-like protein
VHSDIDDVSALDEQIISRVAERIAKALIDDLETVTAKLTPPAQNEQLTVEQVAKRLGVARSTVYSHWREWGGYKLGAGPKAPIRFDSSTLTPTKARPKPTGTAAAKPPARPTRRRGRRSDLLLDAPRFVQPIGPAA